MRSSPFAHDRGPALGSFSPHSFSLSLSETILPPLDPSAAAGARKRCAGGSVHRAQANRAELVSPVARGNGRSSNEAQRAVVSSQLGYGNSRRLFASKWTRALSQAFTPLRHRPFPTQHTDLFCCLVVDSSRSETLTPPLSPRAPLSPPSFLMPLAFAFGSEQIQRRRYLQSMHHVRCTKCCFVIFGDSIGVAGQKRSIDLSRRNVCRCLVDFPNPSILPRLEISGCGRIRCSYVGDVGVNAGRRRRRRVCAVDHRSLARP